MTYSVTADQYARLTDARDNWPKRLDLGGAFCKKAEPLNCC